jgi:hypothetical protein
MLVYGVLNQEGIFTDVSKSERGCKRYATLNNYSAIGYRNVNHYYVIETHKKVGKRWIKT